MKCGVAAILGALFFTACANQPAVVRRERYSWPPPGETRGSYGVHPVYTSPGQPYVDPVTQNLLNGYQRIFDAAEKLPEPQRDAELDRLDRMMQNDIDQSNRLIEQSDQRYYDMRVEQQLENINNSILLQNRL